MNRKLKNPLDICAHAHAMVVEEIMALIGRESSDPKTYRRLLESFELSTLVRTRDELLEGLDFPLFSLLPPVQKILPAPEETTDEIHCALRRSGASTRAGMALTAEPALP